VLEREMRIDEADLVAAGMKVIETSPDTLRATLWVSSWLSACTVDAMLGRNWAQKHYPNDFATLAPVSGDDGSDWRYVRMSYLGESLFNLKNLPGFDDRVREWSTMEPESLIAEAFCARHLQVCGVPFRFVSPGGTGRTHDADILDSAGDVGGAVEFQGQGRKDGLWRRNTSVEPQGRRATAAAHAGGIHLHSRTVQLVDHGGEQPSGRYRARCVF
jgi:hypothetical protein